MLISIAICTYNNARKLAAVLESLQGLTCPASLAYEILVIDNNSRDETKAIVEQWREVWGGRLRYLFEGQQGLSYARNRAWKEAAGDIISYIDDDVRVDPGWLLAVAGAFEEHGAAVVGGRSHLIYPSIRPSWLPEDYEFLLSRLDYGEQVIVDVDRDLFGVNFSVKKSWLEAVGGFDTTLGRCGRSLSSGEESDLLKRIREKGGIAVYEPKAMVQHIVSADRMKKQWFRKRLFAAGWDSVMIAGKDGRALPSVSATAIQAIRCCGSIPKSIVSGDLSPKTVFRKEMVAVHVLGRLCARLRLGVVSRTGTVR